MKSFCIRKNIHGDIHELYEILPSDDCSDFPWIFKFSDFPEKVTVGPKDDMNTWFWCPVMISYKKLGVLVSAQGRAVDP